MKIVSYNVNGIRAALKRGFFEWLQEEQPDIICIQETKAHKDQLDTNIFTELGYHQYWFSAQKKGYSSVAIFSKVEPKNVEYGIGIEKYDNEGRFLRANYENFTLINSYFPSGTTGGSRQDYKMEYLADVQLYTNELQKTQKNIILCGDYNICHKEIDISNPKNKHNVSGFLPEEREWITKFLESGFTDSFRMFNETADNYSWWSYRANSRARNVGWRLDYHMISNNIKNNITNSYIMPEIHHSDHCPVVLETKGL